MNGAYDYRDERKAQEVQKKISALMGAGARGKCHRCEETVYLAEQVGPVNGLIYHKGCFKCHVCNQQLTLQTFRTSQVDSDPDIYCHVHQPRMKATHVGIDAFGIRDRVDAQALASGGGMNQQVRGEGQSHFDINAMQIKGAMNAPKQSIKFKLRTQGDYQAAKLDTQAVGIRGALDAQKLQGRYTKNKMDQHHFPAYVFKRKEQILAAQEELERVHREEEDRKMQQFQEERQREAEKVDAEIQEEWEKKLQQLTQRFESQGKKMKKDDKKIMDLEKDALARSMQKKKEEEQKQRTLRLVKREQEETSEMVAEHSAQMLDLLFQQQKELKDDLEEEIIKKQDEGADEEELEDLLVAREIVEEETKKKEIPPPGPPSCRKRDLYTSPDVFDELDERVFEVAEADQKTYTDLVNKLTEGCITDLEKVRAIFRWITVKDLNVMKFDETLDKDTPLGLLRGIKYGSETYHTLFMRLCGYANIHCVEVKGHAKSVGYEPGMKIREGQFQNTWNAVVVDGDWRLIQCNWGARHLVLDKEKRRSHSHSHGGSSSAQKEKKKAEKIRYQYDEHYFLTDPDEFGMEFIPFDPQYQLLEKSMSMDQFIEQPFVRSVFFELGMGFEGSPQAVLVANSRGGAEVRLKVPELIARDTVFHYQLKFAERERRHLEDYRGTKLERFVYQSTTDQLTVFSVHVPTVGEYFMEVFGNRMLDATKVQEADNPLQPFRLKCACKFRIVCSEMSGKMHALPNCASGEWGPAKALRHFSMTPVTHKNPIINVSDQVEIKFDLAQPLSFITRLRTNGLDDHVLEEFIVHKVEGDSMSVRVKFPQPAQYGLDIYARAKGAPKTSMAHACKYLINCSEVSRPTPVPLNLMDPWAPVNISNGTGPSKPPEKLGALSLFQKLGLKAVSHKEPKIPIYEPNHNQLKMEFLLPAQTQLTFSLRREPEEDHRDMVNMTRDPDHGMARFYITLLRPGAYVFSLFARNPTADGALRQWNNVYNYRIFFGVPDDSTLKKKKKGK